MTEQEEMSRPVCCRRVQCAPACTYFKPRGVPLCELEEVCLGLDELEALRLADLEGMYQDQAAEKMQVSRPTFSRIVETARRKVAEAIVRGKALKLEGGNVMMNGSRKFCCAECQHTWDVPFGTGRPEACPKCKSTNLHREGAGGGRGNGQCRGRGQGRGWCGGRGAGRKAGAAAGTGEQSKA